jgi:NAD-dependent dihydropyrimidine dehydrogenase PreA subunit
VIEFINEATCINCNKCVEVCPTDVFETGSPVPVIERLDDCTACMNCELYCPTDAIYVSPIHEPEPALDKAAVIASGVMGSYARAMNWSHGQAPDGYGDNHLLRLRLEGAGELDPNDRDYAIRKRLKESFAGNLIPVEPIEP